MTGPLYAQSGFPLIRFISHHGQSDGEGGAFAIFAVGCRPGNIIDGLKVAFEE
ncbi:MAG: hypothetical protein IKD70_09305 [Eggerthellaceae bacterium]|nr:hypothetical protein [Eggerthellaceae bacterium]